jgi:hypothetical protein
MLGDGAGAVTATKPPTGTQGNGTSVSNMDIGLGTAGDASYGLSNTSINPKTDTNTGSKSKTTRDEYVAPAPTQEVAPPKQEQILEAIKADDEITKLISETAATIGHYDYQLINYISARLVLEDFNLSGSLYDRVKGICDELIADSYVDYLFVDGSTHIISPQLDFGYSRGSSITDPIEALQFFLDVCGIFNDVFDVANAVIYFIRGQVVNAAITVVCLAFFGLAESLKAIRGVINTLDDLAVYIGKNFGDIAKGMIDYVSNALQLIEYGLQWLSIGAGVVKEFFGKFITVIKNFGAKIVEAAAGYVDEFILNMDYLSRNGIQSLIPEVDIAETIAIKTGNNAGEEIIEEFAGNAGKKGAGELGKGSEKSIKSVGGNKQANKIAKELGFEKRAEELKEVFLNSKKAGALYDIMINTKTREIVLVSHSGSDIVSTNLIYK